MAAIESGRATSPGRRERVLLAAGVLALAIFPILLTEFPPVTDLPQHLAQVRLFHEALAHPGGQYIIQWAAPNTLVYYLILGLWAVLPLDLVARAVMVLVVLLWVMAIHGLGAGRHRAMPASVLAALLIFNRSFYWGFLNFLIGFPVFVLWFILTTEETHELTWKRWAALAGVSILLYGSHALWFAVGGMWLIVISLVKRIPARTFVFRLTALAPCGLASLLWYPALSRSRVLAGYDVAPHWSGLFDRLAGVLQGLFGGIPSGLAAVPFLAIYAWIGLSIWQNRARIKSLVDRDLLAAALFFLAIAAVAPDKFINTIYFGSRWLPVAMIFLLLALPAPALRRRVMNAFAGGLAAAFFLATAFLWHEFDRVDLSGFRPSLERIAPSSRVLGLDLVKESAYISDRPFLQFSAYAQVYRGGELNFSFAEHYSGLVAWRGKRNVPWSRILDWYAEKTQTSDFAHFDFVLVNGDEMDHKRMASFQELSAVTGHGKWRVYKVVSPPAH